MPHYLIADAVLDFPGPSVEQVVAKVHALYHDKRPVTTVAVAQALGTDAPIVEDRLQRALHCRLLSHVPGQGWIPPVK
jgi:hypothetical protein